MKINATTLVEELKKEFKYQYDKDIAVHTRELLKMVEEL